AECFPCRIEHDQLDIALLAESIDATGQLAEHTLVEQVVVGSIEREPRDFPFDFHLEELKFVELGRNQRQRAKNFDARAARRLMYGHEIAPVYAPAGQCAGWPQGQLPVRKNGGFRESEL